ncbi:MAG TPA: hypothetical protein VI504_04235 [Candidatus Eisenbacteria bacterium]
MTSAREPPGLAPASALAAFFASVSPRLFVDLEAAGVLSGLDDALAEREWHAVALHACIRGAVADGGHGDATADLVDAFHDLVLPRLAGGTEIPALRALLAARYGEYDGIARTLGRDGAARVPAAIAAACARHVRPRDPEALAETFAPLLEALAEGAAAALAESATTELAGAEVEDEGRAPGITLPPLEPLLGITAHLDAAGIAWAVGGSGLLAALGLVNVANDWDVQVEAAPEQLQWLFAGVPHTFHGHGGCHADWKLAFESARTELIPRFAFYAPGGIVSVPLRVSRRRWGLPIASPEGWACAYWLMGEYDAPAERARRAKRAEKLFAWLDAYGADATRLEELLAEPLPGPLAEKLRALRAA